MFQWLKNLFSKPAAVTPVSRPMQSALANGTIVVARWGGGSATPVPPLPPVSAAQTPTIAQALPAYPILSWELPCDDGQVGQGAHPERAAWTKALVDNIVDNWFVIASATDIATAIPNYAKLTVSQQQSVFAELMCRVAEYESSWDPTCTSPDVDPNQTAIGFYQLNVQDQSYWETGTSFTADQLKDPINNIKCGVALICTEVRWNNRIIYTKGQKQGQLFFETLLINAKYNTYEPKIAPAVQKFSDSLLQS